MVQTETLEQFYQRHRGTSGQHFPVNNTGHGHFNVFVRSGCDHQTPFSRRDFYKVTLLIGSGRMHYDYRVIDIDRPALVFSGPLVPSSWEPISDIQEGWFCLFTDAFIESHEHRSTLRDFPLFQVGADHVVFLDDRQFEFFSTTLGKMMEEMNSDYANKYDLLRNYLHIILHEALKIQPPTTYKRNAGAAARITASFLELLERQFPIDSPEQHLRFKTANEYAQLLSVHANHLNRSVKEITGKTTTQHISERVIKEAHALLKHTDWNIAQIADSLGFEEPAYFANFFKKHAGSAPGVARLTTYPS
jgi:AraC family transcriptional activator of pobA